MILVISGTNRKGSNTAKVAKHYFDTLQSHTSEEVNFLDLSNIPLAWYENEDFSKGNQHPELTQLQENLIIPANKFVFIIPEYNGGFPGVIKLFLDALSINKSMESFKNGSKKALITGVSSGRAGNLRGLEHFTGILNYLNIYVLPNRLPISLVDKIVDSEGNIIDENTLFVIENQIKDFLV